jgi:hypothetical protein
MPLFAHRCLSGHTRDVYAHNLLERACRTIVCEACHQTMSPILSLGQALTYFGEKGGGRWIHNLGPEPIRVTSTKQHEDLMKAAGVTWAPPRRGMPGQWS